MYNSVDALIKADLISKYEDTNSINDEGSIRINAASRLFLQGQTASKDKLIDTDIATKLMAKENAGFKNTPAHISVGLPDLASPLIRKMVVFEEHENLQVVETREIRNEIKALQLVFSLAAVGFSATPCLER